MDDLRVPLFLETPIYIYIYNIFFFFRRPYFFDFGFNLDRVTWTKIHGSLATTSFAEFSRADGGPGWGAGKEPRWSSSPRKTSAQAKGRLIFNDIYSNQ